MKFRALATMSFCTLLSVGVVSSTLVTSALAKSTTKPVAPPEKPMPSPEKPALPTDQPPAKEKPAPDEKPKPANKPSPATQSNTADSEFPSPAELMKKLRAERDRKAKASQVVYFNLYEPMAERPADFSLFGDYRLNLRTLLERLEQVKADNKVKGVLITLGNPSLSLAQAQEVRDGLAAVVKSGKPVFIHADVYDTALYTLASGASDICLLEGGELSMPGIGIESMFLKNLFDKVGVKADYVQIGEYKGADEQYTRSAATEELRGEMTKLVGGLYDEIIAGIASARKIKKEVVQQSIDESMVSGKLALSRGLVDHLIDQDGLRDLLTKKFGGEIELNAAYGMPKREAVDFSNPFGLIASLTKKPESEEPSNKATVAIIYAEGVIVDGEAGDGLFSESGVGSESMRKAFRQALRDDNIKAVLIRIDSPGGSALASEVMWQAARRVAEKKPVFISIGGMAASGGYYLASAGETIYADPTAIVGSIGVVGGKFVYEGLFEKLGIKTETFQRGRNADLFSSNQPFTDRQRVMVTSWMKQTYDQFTSRVMVTRKGRIQDIDQVARGRIFTARQAKELGMVDEIGGIQSAITAVAKKANLKAGEFDIKQVPSPKTLGDYLSGNAGSQEARFPFQPKIEIKLDGLLGSFSPALRRQFMQQMQTLKLLQDRPVILVSPYTVTVK